MASEAEYLTVREVMARLRVERDSVEAWIHNGDLVAIDATAPSGRRRQIRILASSLDAFIKARTLQPTAVTAAA